MSNVPSSYSVQLLASIERTISNERLKRYLRATGQDVSQALQLYEYNVRLSEVLYGILHGLEVALRNAEHHALTASYGTASWYDTAPLSRYWKAKIIDAKTRPGAAGAPGKIVAELTFGFWVDLIAKHNNNAIWIGKKLSMAFPHTALHRRQIHQRLKTVQLLRNRIAHHEPVLTSAKTLYNGEGTIALAELIECVEWICAETAAWIKTQFGYAEAERILDVVKASGISL
jgi:malonyl CoA-acyl carrier protein transacylase